MRGSLQRGAKSRSLQDVWVGPANRSKRWTTRCLTQTLPLHPPARLGRPRLRHSAVDPRKLLLQFDDLPRSGPGIGKDDHAPSPPCPGQPRAEDTELGRGLDQDIGFLAARLVVVAE